MAFLRQFAVILLLAGFVHAADLAVLRNGFSISHVSREVIGANTRLHLQDGGYVDVPTALIDSFEHDAAPISQPAAATQPTPPVRVANATASTAVAQPFDLQLAVANASGKHYIDPDLIQSIIRQESGGNVHARSKKGAQGLMQLMPGTAAKLGVTDAYDGNANVDAGTRYFRDLLERYNGDMIKALAAYNAGPQRVDQYKGVPPYTETRRYVAAIVHDFNRKKLAQMKSASTKATATSAAHKTASSKATASTKKIQTASVTTGSTGGEQ
jgi:soluble lytic murein transglycosylase-like protein